MIFEKSWQLRAILFSLFSFLSPAHAEYTSSISLQLSGEVNEIVVDVPKGWHQQTDSMVPYCDIELTHHSGNKRCWIFTSVLHHPVDDLQSYLWRCAADLKEFIYAEEGVEISKGEYLSPSKMLYTQFTYSNASASGAAVVYLIDNYLIGFVVENRNCDEDLMKDCNALLNNISIYFHGGRP